MWAVVNTFAFVGEPVEWQDVQLPVAFAMPVALISWPFVAPRKLVVLWHEAQLDVLDMVLAGGRNEAWFAG